MWIRRSSPGRPAMDLYWFPHAGSGSALARALARVVPPLWGVQAVLLPGREERYREPALIHIEDFLAAFGPQLAEDLRGPYVLGGHSLGAFLGHRVALWMRQQDLPTPSALVVCGMGPQVPGANPWQGAAALQADAQILARMTASGQWPAELLDDPVALQQALSTYKADLALYHSAHGHAPPPALDIPVLAYCGVHDAAAGRTVMASWAQATTATLTLRVLQGDHMFVTGEPFAQALRDDLGSWIKYHQETST